MPSHGFSHEARNSTKIDWFTPPHIFNALGLTFDLDPCSAGEGKDCVPAINRYTIEDDGLKKDWFGLVFCNPPYGSQTSFWLEKMSQHKNGIALVFARSGTKWWQKLAPTTSLICFMSGRVKFINGQTNKIEAAAGADSVLMAWGDTSANALRQSKLGLCMKLDTRDVD